MGKRQAAGTKPGTKKKGSAEDLTAPIGLPALRRLVDWFNRNQRILPWRETPTLYRVWISEIMLQQTQVATALPYFERFMREFPTVEALALAPDDMVMKAWAGLGYYSRARNLHRGAREIVESDGGFPQTHEGWLEIPGVGPYTAGAITSIALGLPEPIVDGNVERVFARMRRLARPAGAGESRYKEKLWKLSRLAVTAAFRAELSPSHLNQAWMELGATVCSPRNPRCELCPVARDCDARLAGETEKYPEKKKRAAWVEISERRVALVDFPRGLVYVERTAQGEWRAGLWDFPTTVPGEVGRKLSKPGKFGGFNRLGTIESRHVVTKHKITRALEVSAVSSECAEFRGGAGRWVSMAEPEVGLGSASRKGIRAILERFGDRQ